MSAASHVGLCARCAHGRRVETRRGSVFLLCELASRDPRFSRYPRLPVQHCSGFTAAAPDEPAPES
jgi:hypothetical protein